MSRNAYKQPFLSTSIWNLPIGRNAVYVAAQLPPRTSKAAGWEARVFAMDKTQSAITIFHNGGQHANRSESDTCADVLGAQIALNQHCVVPTSGLNYSAALIGLDGTSLYEVGNFCHQTAGILNACTIGPVGGTGLGPPGLATAGHGRQYGTIFDDGLTGAAGGSGLSTLGGSIRIGEFTNGSIPHAVAIDVNGFTDLGFRTNYSSFVSSTDGNGYRWPATHADGGCSTPGSNNFYGNATATGSADVPQSRAGSLYALKAGFGGSNASGWVVADMVVGGAFGIQTVPGQIMATTALLYGFYEVNNATISAFQVCGEDTKVTTSSVPNVLTEFSSLYGFGLPQSPSATGSAGKWASDMATIWANLYVVDNNSLANYNNSVSNGTGAGGGTPLVPLAAGFGASGLAAPFLQEQQAATLTASTTLVVPNAVTTAGNRGVVVAGAIAAGSAAAPTQVGASWGPSTPQTGATNSQILLAAHTVTVGNFVTFAVLERASVVGVLSSVSDSKGNTWAQISGATLTHSPLEIEVWGAHITTGGSTILKAIYNANGAGCGIASEWNGSNEAPQVSVITNNGTGTALTSGSTATATALDLVIAVYGATGSNTFSAPAFSPAGTSINNPDISSTATGSNNCILQASETISGAAAQSFSATISASTGWVVILLTLGPASSGGGTPTLSIADANGDTWTQRFAVTTGAGNGTHAAWDAPLTSSLAASGITITSSLSGAIAAEFYELQLPYQFQAQATATGNSTAPTRAITPANTTDIQVGSVFWNGAATIGSLPGGAWVSDTSLAGVGGAGIGLQTGANAPASVSSQTYAGTLSGGSLWVAGEINYALASSTVPGTPAAPVITAGQGTLTVDWAFISTDVGDTSSTVTPYISGVAQTATVVSAPTSIVTLTLNPGTLYTFDVFVTSPAGNGSRSAQSSPAVSPLAAPPPPPPPPPLPGTPVSTQPTVQAPSLYRDLADVRQRLAALESAAPQSLSAADSTGQVRVIQGALDIVPGHAGLFGLVILDNTGTIIFEQSD